MFQVVMELQEIPTHARALADVFATSGSPPRFAEEIS
jgi:hypothetical protein